MKGFVDPDAKSGFVDPDVAAQSSPIVAQSVPSAPQEQPQVEPSSILGRVWEGVKDPFVGGLQLAARAMPGVDTGIVDQMVRDRETEYDARRKAAGAEGIDWARIGGNVASPINLVGGIAAQGASLPARMAASAATSAASSALQPVTQGTSFAKEKAEQAGAGAGLGAAIPVVGAAASRIVQPHTSAAVKDLMSKGITPTLGEMLGTGAKSIEDRLMSMPVVGDVISYARRGSIKDMNKAIYDMALEPIGEKSTAPIGREAVNEIYNKLSSAYSNLLTGKQIKLDQDFSKDIGKIWQQTSVMSVDAQKQFKNIINNKIMRARSATGDIEGEAMKAIDSELGRLARGFGRDPNINNRMIGEALEDVKGALRGAVSRSDPALVPEMQKIDQGYAVYARIRNAASRTGSKEGVITPATLNAAVTKLDDSVGKGGTAKGTAFMRKFADEANSVLGSTYPDSGTSGRAMMNLLMLGGATYINPYSLMFGSITTLPYLPGAKQAIAAAMTKRPAGAQGVADALQTGLQYAAPGLAAGVTGQAQ